MASSFEYFRTLYTPALASIAVVVFVWAAFAWRRTPIKLPYPPGPPEKGLLSGNLRDIPAEKAWHTYVEWGRKYGDIIHFRVYDKHTVILNSLEDNIELLEKRSIIYSDRPSMPMMDLMGWSEFETALMRYGPKWRSHRRIYQKFLKPEASLTYRHIQTRKTLEFMVRILTTPDDFSSHYRTLAAAIIMYGYDVTPKNDYFVGLAERAIQRLSASVPPDASLFFTFPIIRYLPTWFPGTQFKQFALEAKKWAHEMRDVPLSSVQKQIKEGAAPNCVVTDLLETCQSKEEFDDIKGVVCTSYAGGADTAVSSIGTFFLAMTLFPDAQRQAKEEIDTIIGLERLITYDDRLSLPYVEAMYREVMRWRPVVPLSVFHACSSDDVYRGFYISKGATVVSNVWAIAHDPRRYLNPDLFNPSRFFDENGNLNNDDVGYTFGFGRRKCPGRHMASDTVWLAIAMSLQNFDIQKKLNSNGDEIPVSGEYCDGLLSHPLPYECSITPRSTEARNVILEAVGKMPKF